MITAIPMIMPTSMTMITPTTTPTIMITAMTMSMVITTATAPPGRRRRG